MGKKRGLPRTMGHRAAVENIKDIVKASSKIGIKYLTLYAFSTENWKRPSDEVNALMSLLVEFLKKEIDELNENNVKIITIGNIKRLPMVCQNELERAERITKDNNGLVLNLALNYGGREEITNAVKEIAADLKNQKISYDDISEELISKYMYTSKLPDPDLMIRTSGELRLSNFLLWQLAYSELWFSSIYWPDFKPENLYSAIIDYQKEIEDLAVLNSEGDFMSDKVKRVISAAIAIPILIAFILAGGIAFKIGILAIMLIALFEYIRSYHKTENKAIALVLLIGYILNAVTLFLNKPQYQISIIVLIILMCMITPIFIKKYNVLSSSITALGYVYIVYFFSLLVYIRDLRFGNILIWLVFLIAFGSDTAAYYIGRFFGKKKLCPDISPKKTVAGAYGGVLGSIIGVLLWSTLNGYLHIPWYGSVILGAFGGVISECGDLAASMIKRYSGIKDYGNIMPGHGGILDRFDSILLVTPIVYYYIVFFLG